MHAVRDVRWAAPGSTVFYWESWGEQYAVFDLRSGETHMLPDPTARVLQHLARCSATVKEVAENISLAPDQVCDERFLSYVAGLFLQLQKVGLIEKADT
jgi:PqqD family protein of HPr-rel-A system